MEKELMTAIYNLHRIVERQDIIFYQLLNLLTDKGIMTYEDYQNYCSKEIIDEKLRLIDKVLEEEEKQND